VNPYDDSRRQPIHGKMQIAKWIAFHDLASQSRKRPDNDDNALA
jgi:hypothetical protein